MGPDKNSSIRGGNKKRNKCYIGSPSPTVRPMHSQSLSKRHLRRQDLIHLLLLGVMLHDMASLGQLQQRSSPRLLPTLRD